MPELAERPARATCSAAFRRRATLRRGPDRATADERDAEVSEHRSPAAALEQNVLGLEIAVDRRRRDAPSRAPARGRAAMRRTSSGERRPLAPHSLGERLAMHVLHDDVDEPSPTSSESPELTGTMLGWLSRAVIRASRRNRSRCSSDDVNSYRSTLIATRRCNAMSRARNTTPMPPRPSSRTTWYCAPSRSAIRSRSHLRDTASDAGHRASRAYLRMDRRGTTGSSLLTRTEGR